MKNSHLVENKNEMKIFILLEIRMRKRRPLWAKKHMCVGNLWTSRYYKRLVKAGTHANREA